MRLGRHDITHRLFTFIPQLLGISVLLCIYLNLYFLYNFDFPQIFLLACLHYFLIATLVILAFATAIQLAIDKNRVPAIVRGISLTIFLISLYIALFKSRDFAISRELLFFQKYRAEFDRLLKLPAELSCFPGQSSPCLQAIAPSEVQAWTGQKNILVQRDLDGNVLALALHSRESINYTYLPYDSKVPFSTSIAHYGVYCTQKLDANWFLCAISN